MSPKPEPDFGTPDDLSPEWTEYESRWSVRVADFPGPLEASKFLVRRKQIFAAALRAGIPKEMFTPFSPDKPGFEARIKSAFEKLAEVAGFAAKHAAE